MTEKEKKIAEKLNDPLYTVEFLEKRVSQKADVTTEPIAALQIMGAKGYLDAVKRMAKLEEEASNE